MSLALKLNYNTVTVAGKTVNLIEDYRKDNKVCRFVETLANCKDESAVNYVLDVNYKDCDAFLRSSYNQRADTFRKNARVFNTFAVETKLFGRNIGAGFCALVKREDYYDSVSALLSMMHLLGLDKEYKLLTKYKNQAVFIIVKK